eukprot:CAMPEP_0117463028 /NCGR_PEP_ID=MMETSP0784-20121206/3360_1 /TAXON_ID=39447 /ORGANISM="" /LENGTH=1119 /DNA_ID=CAMNT_0005256815 /DNA_START=137 /DNA_END=3496 /DNA_ORIENTATION=+
MEHDHASTFSSLEAALKGVSAPRRGSQNVVPTPAVVAKTMTRRTRPIKALSSLRLRYSSAMSEKIYSKRLSQGGADDEASPTEMSRRASAFGGSSRSSTPRKNQAATESNRVLDVCFEDGFEPGEIGEADEKPDDSLKHENDNGGDRKLFAREFPINDIIHNASIFKNCTNGLVEAILTNLRTMVIKPGQTIVGEGHVEPQSLFFLLWGEAHSTYCGDHCRDIPEGGYFGETMVFGITQTWKTTVVTKTQCMVSELSRTTLESILQVNEEDASRFIDMFCSIARRRSGEEINAPSGEALRRSPLFEGCSDAFLRHLELGMDRKLYFPGERFVDEMSSNCALYVMDNGSAAVAVSGRTVRTEEIPRVRTRLTNCEDLTSHGAPLSFSAVSSDENGLWRSPSHRSASHDVQSRDELPGVEDSEIVNVLLGQEGFLGMTCNARSCKAQSICDVRVLYRSTFQRALDLFPEDREVIAPRFRRSHDELFPRLQAMLFADTPMHKCSSEFKETLVNRVEKRILGTGERVVLDDLMKNIHPPWTANSAGFCVVHTGHLRIHSDLSTMEVRPGAQLEDQLFRDGETLVTALAPSTISIVHHVAIAKTMEEFPNDRRILMQEFAQQGEEEQPSPPVKNRRKEERVAKILRERSIFADASMEFLDEIITLGSIRVFMPGERIIEQGDDGNSMFILWVGTANVVTEQLDNMDFHPTRTLSSLGALTHGSVFGELVMLGVQPTRTASIVASTICKAWEIDHEAVMALLDRFPTERSQFVDLIGEHLDKLVAPRIVYHPLLSRFHASFRSFLAAHCTRRFCFPGEVVFREGAWGSRMYIMNLGWASVEVYLGHVMRVTGGSHFGFAMISSPGDQRYPVSLVSSTLCQLLVIGRALYQDALQKFPDMREASFALEAEERSRVEWQHTCFGQMAARRARHWRYIEALRGGAQTCEATTPGMHSLCVTFHVWQNVTAMHVEYQREEEERRCVNERRIQQWLTKRRQQMARAKPRVDMRRLVDRNMRTRGPLKFAATQDAKAKTLRGDLSCPAEKSPYLSPSPARRASRTAPGAGPSKPHLPALVAAPDCCDSRVGTAASAPSRPASSSITRCPGSRGGGRRTGLPGMQCAAPVIA